MRSQGTKTLSKMTTASISSKRLDKGASKFDFPLSYVSLHINFKPGVAIGIAKAKAKGILAGSAFRTVDGKTSISSANGPKVANNLAPVTIIPASVSFTTCKAT